MNLILRRVSATKDGIISELMDEKFNFVALCLEHAYPNTEDGTFHAKIPIGEYKCVRGNHRLHEEDKEFETFEVTKIADHSGILFHVGNYNKDSDGCILVGEGFGAKLDGGKMIVKSKEAFKKLMDLQKECDSFDLKVED